MADRAKDRVQALSAQFLELVANLDEQLWQRTWELYARAPTYSVRNLMLARAQLPDAAGVWAGFRRWRQLGFQVSKGERAVWMLAPRLVRAEASARELEEDAAGEEETKLVGWHAVPVFDLTQVIPVSEEAERTLAGVWHRGFLVDDPVPEALWRALLEAAARLGVTVVEEQVRPLGTRGWYSERERTIHIPANAGETARAKTLAHELGHVLLEHASRFPRYRDDEAERAQAELEAETVAAVVLLSWGVRSTLEVSTHYFRAWSQRIPREQLPEVVTEVLARIEHAARQLPLGEPLLAQLATERTSLAERPAPRLGLRP